MANRRRIGLRHLHRWLGIILLAPLLLLIATGIPLNHTDDLDLDRHHIDSPGLLRLYGIRPQPPDQGFQVGQAWISQARGALFLDDRRIDEVPGSLLGAAKLDRLLIVATTQAMALYMPDGRPIDTLPVPEHARPATAFAIQDGHPTVATKAGTYRLDSRLSDWIRGPGELTDHIRARALPAGLRTRITESLAASTLSWERLLLDLHTGRLFGPLGPWVVDAAALTLALLGATGCLIWLRIAMRRGRRSRRNRP